MVARLREGRQELDARVAGRHQGVIAETSQSAAPGGLAGSNLWQEADLNLAVLVMQGQAPDPRLGSLAEAPRIDKPLTRATLLNGLARTLRETRDQASRSA